MYGLKVALDQTSIRACKRQKGSPAYKYTTRLLRHFQVLKIYRPIAHRIPTVLTFGFPEFGFLSFFFQLQKDQLSGFFEYQNKIWHFGSLKSETHHKIM